MGLFDLYRSTARCGTSNQEIIEENNAQVIIDNWDYQVNTYEAYRNFDVDDMRKILVTDEKNYKKMVSEKKFIFYPFQTAESGDYLSWKYDGTNYSDWLIFSLDKQYRYKITGSFRRCNNYLKWIDENGQFQSFPCVIEEPMVGTEFNYNKYIVNATGNLSVFVQKNPITEKLLMNKRFLLDNGSVAKTAYKLRAIDDFFSDSGVLILTMNVTPLAEDDDVNNFIANKETYEWTIAVDQDDIEQEVGFTGTLSATVKKNGVAVNVPVVWSSDDATIVTIDNSGNYELIALGYANITCSLADNPTVSTSIIVSVTDTLFSNTETRVSPSTRIVYQGEVMTYSVRKYTDEVLQPDTYTFVPSGANGKYNIQVLNGNEFTVVSLGFSNEPLVITYTNQTDMTQGTITLELRNYW